jgi:hypothetical protein
MRLKEAHTNVRLFSFLQDYVLASCTNSRMQRVTTFVLLALVLLSGTLASGAQTPPDLRISRCGMDVWGYGNPQITSQLMSIQFENLSAEALTSITWRITTEAGTLDFVDVGHFEPHVTVAHTFKRIHGFSSRVSLEMNDPRACSAIRTVTKSGDIWTEAAVAPATFFVPPVPQDTSVTTPATFDNPSHNPIGIVSCEFTILPHILTKPPRAYGHVYFRNLSQKTIAHITFRAFFGSSGMDFQENGTFSPNTLVNTGDMTRYDLPANVFKDYLDLDSPLSCATVNATYSGGSVWQNPDVGPTEPPFPEPVTSSSP